MGEGMGCRWIERMERIEKNAIQKDRDLLEKWAENKRFRGEKPKIVCLGETNSKKLH